MAMSHFARRRTRRWPLATLIAVAGLLGPGCVLPHDTAWTQPHHHWVYHQDSDTYRCTAHDVTYVRDGDRWVESATHAAPAGQGVVVETDAPGHTWVYFPEHEAYYCRSHTTYYTRHGGRWIARERFDPEPKTGVELALHVEAPWDHPHAWVYYDHDDVYYCDHHRVYYVHDHGRWVARRHVSLGARRGITLSHRAGRPWLHPRHDPFN